MQESLSFQDPTLLEIHPALDGFPELPPEKYEALKASIAEKGILTPLSAMMHEGVLKVVAGRNRRRIAEELHLEAVPVISRNGIAPLDFALEEAVVGRQLTKSGVAFMLFEKHPSLAKEAAARMAGGRPKITGQPLTGSPVSSENPSYGTLSDRYKIPKDYLIKMGKLRREVSEEDWALIRKAILEDEYCITRIFAGQAGREATKGGAKAPVDYAGLCKRSLVSIKSSFENWKTIPFEERAELVSLWEEISNLIPEDLK